MVIRSFMDAFICREIAYAETDKLACLDIMQISMTELISWPLQFESYLSTLILIVLLDHTTAV